MEQKLPFRGGRLAVVSAAFATALIAVVCLAAGAASARAVASGAFANPCVAHAVETPGLYHSLEELDRACGLPTNAASTTTPPAPSTAPTGSALPTSAPCDYCKYHIFTGDSVNVINAKGCLTTTILITYPVSSGCEEGANEIWEIAVLTSGYRALIADYGGTFVCMTAGAESGQRAGAQPCPKELPGYMEFRRPVVSTTCYSGWYYIIPANNWGLTLNVRGGLGEKREIISYPQSCATNSIWYYG